MEKFIGKNFFILEAVQSIINDSYIKTKKDSAISRILLRVKNVPCLAILSSAEAVL